MEDYKETVDAGVDVRVLTPDAGDERIVPIEDLKPEGVPQRVEMTFAPPKYVRTDDGFVQSSDENAKDLIDLVDVGDVVNYMTVKSVDIVDDKRVITLDFFGKEYKIRKAEEMFTALPREVVTEWKNKIQSTMGIYKDYPKEGVMFEDINPVLRNKETLGIMMELLSLKVNVEECDYIVAPESRGFVLASFVCGNLGKPIILARKPGKLPGKVKSYTYKTEYSEDTLEMQEIDLIEKKVWFIDDIYATGGTYEACKNLVEQNGGKLTGGTVIKSVLNKHPEEVQVVL